MIGSQPHTVIGAGASESLMTKIEEGLTLKYRSVYLPIARDALPTSLKVFDFPESMMTTSQREQNNTSRQFYLMNNKFVIIHSDKMAKKIRQEFSRTDDQISSRYFYFATVVIQLPVSCKVPVIFIIVFVTAKILKVSKKIQSSLWL